MTVSGERERKLKQEKLFDECKRKHGPILGFRHYMRELARIEGLVEQQRGGIEYSLNIGNRRLQGHEIEVLVENQPPEESDEEEKESYVSEEREARAMVG